MKVVLITDTHFGARNDSQNFSKYFERFYTNVFFPFLKENDISRVIHLGDIFERRKYINFLSLSHARDYFFEPMRDYQMDLIIGNHDVFYKNTNVLNSPELLLADYPNITQHQEPGVITIDGTQLAMLPWVNSGNHKSSLRWLENTQAQVLFGHLEIQGFEMHIGATNDHGFKPSIFDKFDQVFSGHFHHKSTRGNINYLGSPYEITWNDYADPRGFHVYDTDTRELTFIKNPYRIFHKLYYNDGTMNVEEMIRDDYSDFSGGYVKIVIQQRGNPYGFERLVNAIEAVSPVDISFTNDMLDVAFDDEELLEDVEDTPAIIISSVDQAAPDSLKKPLKKLLLDLHAEALSLTRV